MGGVSVGHAHSGARWAASCLAQVVFGNLVALTEKRLTARIVRLNGVECVLIAVGMRIESREHTFNFVRVKAVLEQVVASLFRRSEDRAELARNLEAFLELQETKWTGKGSVGRIPNKLLQCLSRLVGLAKMVGETHGEHWQREGSLLKEVPVPSVPAQQCNEFHRL